MEMETKKKSQQPTSRRLRLHHHCSYAIFVINHLRLGMHYFDIYDHHHQLLMGASVVARATTMSHHH